MRFERVISTIDAHAAGEPLRIITAGLPPLPGATVLERRRYMAEHYDDIRRTLLFEPRGHADMYGAVLTPAVTPGADFGVLFLTNEGYSTMCGHGVIALTTVLLETGMIPRCEPQTEVIYDSPAGLIRASAKVEDGRVTSVGFHNVPAFRHTQGLDLATSVGPVRADISYGGAFYALVEAAVGGLHVDVLLQRLRADATAVAHRDHNRRGVQGDAVEGVPQATGHVGPVVVPGGLEPGVWGSEAVGAHRCAAAATRPSITTERKAHRRASSWTRRPRSSTRA